MSEFENIEPIPLTAGELGLEALPAETVLNGITSDSREIKPGYLFAALKGSIVDGAEFIQYAARMGAAAAICSAEGANTASNIDIPKIIVEDPRQVYAHFTAKFYPEQPGTIVAVTGTNGKTSVASFLNQIWRTMGVKSAYFGTTGVDAPGFSDSANHTTPEPVKLHRLLSSLSQQGVTHVAMEASSHGLDQCRMDAVQLSAGGFTNLSRDHLDYHETMEDYLGAKMRLFADLLPYGASAVVNTLDPVAQTAVYLAKSNKLKLITVGKSDTDTICIQSVDYTATGQDVTFGYNDRINKMHLELIGGFQVENALMAAGLAIGCGAVPEQVFGAVTALNGVRGRMEHVATAQNGATVFVDYAHTPEALVTALQALRPHVKGQLHVVFGAGGDRDPGKRPMMGKAAKDNADRIYVTDDNPRSEPPAEIRSAIMVAVPDATEIDDRATAIISAIDGLGADDALLIAGKGHELGQIVGDVVLPFDDAEQARVAVMVLEEKQQ